MLTNTIEKTNPLPLRQLVGAEEITKALGLSERHLRRMQARRLIPYIKFGRVLRFDPAAVAAAIENLTVRARGGDRGGQPL